ncbi:armadillo-like helical domain-containing protein [Cavenderia fasciculata]|uniref:Armadillo-like helical domain-containing protein n=1 Tax=Cavenderia fasciculata TaxID=261658 RepID=F4PNI9_CACFS|nr:armadillo-like helical domain-containing protein [Cavenderia fasciculata]EGG23042.1 armadillo-like helical domain-containing protein [Cavenderia fasciculata]|eukprot:XP_004360893.1 armadillo-like helical domain-containing protein [Cavenderia fasciculata]
MNLFSSLMRPKNKYSLENLKYLHSTLVKNSTITNQNSGVVVETLRQIAEVMIWGDQNNNTLFDFFLEKNLLGFFINILEQKTSSDVIIQLLQTLSILVENLRNRNSIFALFSNNVINEIIIHKFDFSNEEVLAYYVSFLKALSLKLDQNTINFFFNGQERDFPLYTEAIKFVNHKETIFRRISSFPNLAGEGSGSEHNSPKKVKKQSSTAASTTKSNTNSINIGGNNQQQQQPHVFNTANNTNNTANSTNNSTSSPNIGSVGSATNNNTPPSGTQFGDLTQSGGSVQHIKIVSDDEDNYIYNNDLGSNLSSPPSSPRGKQQHNNGSTHQLPNSSNNGPHHPTNPQIKRLSANLQTKLAKSELSSSLDSGSTNMSFDSQNDTQSIGKRNSLKSAAKSHKPKNEYKDMLLLLLNKDRETFGVVCMLYSLLKNSYIDSKILEIGGVLPYRLAKAKKLLQGLLSPESRPSNTMSSSLPANLTSSHHRSKSESYALSTQQTGPSTKVSHDGISSSRNPGRSSPSLFNDLDSNNNNNNNNNINHSLPTSPIMQTPLSKISASLTSSTLSAQASGGPILRIFKSKEQIDSEDQEQRELERLRIIEKEEEDEEFIPVPDSYQKEFTRDLIERIFYVLMNSNQFRLVTLQMTYLVLKELVYSSESPSKLTENQFEMLEEAYLVVTNNLKDCLSGSTAPIFLELFEDEMGSYKQIKFEMLLKEAALILPVPERPISRLSLARRLPSGEVEKTQKAIQQFLVLREMKYTLLRKREKLLPIKQPQYPMVREKEHFRIDMSMFDTIDYVAISKKPLSTPAQASPGSSAPGSGATTGPPLPYSFVLYHNLLLNLDRNNIQPPPNAPKQTKDDHQQYGIITHIAPLQRIEIEVSHLDPCVLRVFSHPTTWGVDMIFDEEKKCLSAKSLLERARDDFRASKMRQIYALLGERDPDDDDVDNDGAESNSPLHGPGRKKSLSKIFQPVDASNSHPLSFSGTDFVMTTRKMSGGNKQIPLSTSTTTTPTKNAVLSRLIDDDDQSSKSTKRFSKENIFMSFLNDTDDTFLKEQDENIMESSSSNNNNNQDFDLNLNLNLFIKKGNNQQVENQVKSGESQINNESTLENNNPDIVFENFNNNNDGNNIISNNINSDDNNNSSNNINNDNNSDNNSEPSEEKEQANQIHQGLEDIDLNSNDNNNNNNTTNIDDNNDNQIIVDENIENIKSKDTEEESIL